MIRFSENDETYYFNPDSGEFSYSGDHKAIVETLDTIESAASVVQTDYTGADGSITPKRRVYSPEKARKMVTNLLNEVSGVTILDEVKLADKQYVRPQIVEGPLGSHPTTIELTGFYRKDGELFNKTNIPDSAQHIPPNEDIPDGYVEFTGEQGGTYAMSPQDLADEIDGVSVDDVIEELGETIAEGEPSEAASEKIPPGDRETPDGVSGPIEDWDPDDVEGMVTPSNRYAEIGSDAHPLFWRQPEPDEVDEFVEEIRKDEEWQRGEEGFEKGFFDDENTENYHTDEDGNYNPERLEQHDEWTDNLVNDDAAVPEGEEPVGMIVLGPPGAGKGWWQEQVESGSYGEDDLGGREFTHVNSDETKEPIPEYTGGNASEVHAEASKMAKDNLFPKATEDRHNMILDKVATTPDSTIRMVEKLEEEGYDIRASFVDVPEEKALHNAVSRFYQEGRFTPTEYMLDGGPGEGESARDGSRNSFDEIIEAAGIPEEKIGRFSNDVEWGEAPDGIEVGDELLKTILEFYGFELAKKYAQ